MTKYDNEIWLNTGWYMKYDYIWNITDNEIWLLQVIATHFTRMTAATTKNRPRMMAHTAMTAFGTSGDISGARVPASSMPNGWPPSMARAGQVHGPLQSSDCSRGFRRPGGAGGGGRWKKGGGSPPQSQSKSQEGGGLRRSSEAMAFASCRREKRKGIKIREKKSTLTGIESEEKKLTSAHLQMFSGESILIKHWKTF